MDNKKVVLYRKENIVKVEASLDNLSLLNTFLSVKSPTAKFTKAYQSGRWDGIYRFLRLRDHTFPSGFLYSTIDFLNNANVPVDVIDLRIKPTKKINVESKVELRPYQQKVLQQMLQAEQGIVWLPVNAGKTYIGLELVNQLKLRTLWIVPSKEILLQTAEKMNELLNIKAGVIGMGYHNIAPITLGMIQTLSKNQGYRDFIDEINSSFDVLIFDECHKVAHNTYQKFLLKATMYYRYGLSGTPKHRNTVDVHFMHGIFGNVIAKMNQKDLFNLSISVKPKIYMIRHKHENITYTDYQELYTEQIVNNKSRNDKVIKIVEKFYKQKKQIVIMLERIQHGEIIQKMLNEKKIPNIFAYGNMKADERKEALDKFEAGEIPILIATNILNEGINLHSMDAIVVVDGGKSPVKTVQRVGRVLRSRIGKEEALVIDFYDENQKILTYHANKRKQTYKKEFGNVSLI